MNWSLLRETIVSHFRAASRQEVIRSLVEFPNFFEGWFTAETLFAIRTRWPAARLLSNTNHEGFEKPDVVVLHRGFTAVVALKHIATCHPDGPSRWDGAKESTVARDIMKLRCSSDQEATRRVLVF